MPIPELTPETLRRVDMKLAVIDFRDLLMAADFGEVDAHLKWQPKPAGDLSESIRPRSAQ
jgi:hypothetical protein